MITQGQREDPTASAQVISTLLAAGVRLRADEVYRKTGFSVPGEDDEVIEPQKAADSAGLPDLADLFKASNGNGSRPTASESETAKAAAESATDSTPKKKTEKKADAKVA